MSGDPRGPKLYRRSKAPGARARAAGQVAAPASTSTPVNVVDGPGVRTITSLTNPIVKDMRGLQSKKERAETGLFLAEGLKLITDALAAGWRVRTLAYCDQVRAQPMVQRAIEAAIASGTDVIEVNEAVLEKISRRDNPQMVVGVIEQRIMTLDALDPAGTTVLVALEGIRDPGNLGTIIRTIDSVGASGAILVGETTDPFALEAVRATMGSIFHVPLYRATVDDFTAFVAATRLPVYGTHLAGAVDYRSIPYPEPALLLMGNEQSGLPDRLVAICDAVVKIPMRGQADSLNLAIATAVTLYEMRRSQL